MVVCWGFCFLLAACARALRWVVQLPALLCCEAMVWALTFIAFPLRMLTAVDRERKLGRLVGEMQWQMEELVWVNRELEEKLQAARREQDAMDALLDEMEEEQEDAYARIDALEAQVKALRQENTRLNEHKGKSMWDKDNNAASPPARHGSIDDKKPSESPCPWVASGRSEAVTQEEEEDATAAALKLKSAADPAAAAEEESMSMARRQANNDKKAVARRRSLFSVGMSVAVGAVACSADAACLPLLAGLFAVVGVSMRSVLRCRAADAVALLSLNWFLLGLLTSPMLPGLAHALLPRAARALGGPALAA